MSELERPPVMHLVNSASNFNTANLLHTNMPLLPAQSDLFLQGSGAKAEQKSCTHLTEINAPEC